MAAMYSKLARRTWARSGCAAPPGLKDDILFVVPCYVWMRALAQRLPVGAKLGNADRYQDRRSGVCAVDVLE